MERSGLPKKAIPIVCAIMEEGNTFLIARRGPGQSHAGMWELPGGKIHEEESPSDALIREIFEELGVRIIVGRQLTTVTHAYPTFTIALTPFLGRIAEGVPSAHEHSELRWILPQQAWEFTWTEADVPIVREYIELKEKGV